MTKTNLVDFIVSEFQEPSGQPVSRIKIESLKKSDLEDFIKEKCSIEEVENWISNNG